MSRDVEDDFEWETRRASVPFHVHAVAGSCAGIVEHVAMFPLDTAKTHMQASRAQLGLGAALRAVLCERGAVGLMRGSAVIGAGCVPAHVGLFGTYELGMARLVDREEHQPLRSGFCGAAASVAHDVVLTPHDVVKQQLQLGRYTGTADCIASLVRKDGLVAFYRSLPTTMAMNVPFLGLFAAANESLKLLLRQRQGRADATLSGASGYFACAGVCGGFASALTSPLDVVKTRLQTSDMPACSSGARAAFSTARTIMAEEGMHGFFRGVAPRVMLAVPASAISWGTYENVRHFLQGYLTDGGRSRAGDGAGAVNFFVGAEEVHALLARPVIVREPLLEYELTQVGTSTSQMLVVNNPSDVPLAVQLVFAACDPLPSEANSTCDVGFKLPEEASPTAATLPAAP